ncbi:MAG: SCO family protein [Leptospirales bacterium]|nr:SCO family protein [Leptospirales bacterium]
MLRRFGYLVVVLVIACGPNFPSITPVPAVDVTLKGPGGNISFLSLVREHKVTLVFFGYTHCPDFCPSTLHRLSETFNELSEADRGRVSVLFISVDPARDTPRLADDYAKRFHKAFRGFSAEPAVVVSMLRSYNRLDVVPGATRGPYLVDHTTSILWFENEMHVKNIPASFLVSDLLADLRRL